MPDDALPADEPSAAAPDADRAESPPSSPAPDSAPPAAPGPDAPDSAPPTAESEANATGASSADTASDTKPGPQDEPGKERPSARADGAESKDQPGKSATSGQSGQSGKSGKSAGGGSSKEQSGRKREGRRSGGSRDRGPLRPGVVCRYGMMRQLGLFRHKPEMELTVGTKVVLRTERGVELGEVITVVTESDQPCQGCMTPEKLGECLDANGSDYPFRRDGKVLRLANAQDVIDFRHLAGSAGEESAYCRRQIKELKLDMKLVTVEHLLGGERIIFYFSAEHRVDFRELVRRLAAEFRTRIEMRQVGARDEARLVADYERCGQRCCCQQFLKDLKPVSMRMAKTQKATLDPSKISGRCGRLMCCLRYEDAGYEALRKKLPRRNTWVRTNEVIGRVTDTQILTQLVRLSLVDGTAVVVGNDEIVERGVEPPPPPEPRASRSRPPRDRSNRRLLRDELDKKGKDQDSAEEKAPAKGQAPSGGRDQGKGQAPQQGDSGKDAAAGEGDGTRKKRRRRRSRRKKSGGAGQASQQTQPRAKGGGSSESQGQAPPAADSKPAGGQAGGGEAKSGDQSQAQQGQGKKKRDRPPRRRRGRRRKKKKPS